MYARHLVISQAISNISDPNLYLGQDVGFAKNHKTVLTSSSINFKYGYL